MKRREFIPVLACALKCADKHIDEVSQNPSNADEIWVYFDDDTYLSIGVSDLSLLDILGYVALIVRAEHQKDQLKIKPQKITRRGIYSNGKWYFTENLLMHLGQEVEVIPLGRSLLVKNFSGQIIETISFS